MNWGHPLSGGTSVGKYFIDRGGVTAMPAPFADAGVNALFQQIGSHRSMLFPAQVGHFLSYDKRGLDVGDDVDGDGVADMTDVSMTVTMVGHEPVVVSAGSFARAARYEQGLVQRVRLSRDGALRESTTLTTVWYVSGIGMVKMTVDKSGHQGTSTTTNQLRSYQVGGASGGAAEDLGRPFFTPPFFDPLTHVNTVTPGSTSVSATLTMMPLNFVEVVGAGYEEPGPGGEGETPPETAPAILHWVSPPDEVWPSVSQ